MNRWNDPMRLLSEQPNFIVTYCKSYDRVSGFPSSCAISLVLCIALNKPHDLLAHVLSKGREEPKRFENTKKKHTSEGKRGGKKCELCYLKPVQILVVTRVRDDGASRFRRLASEASVSEKLGHFFASCYRKLVSSGRTCNHQPTRTMLSQTRLLAPPFAS